MIIPRREQPERHQKPPEGAASTEPLSPMQLKILNMTHYLAAVVKAKASGTPGTMTLKMAIGELKQAHPPLDEEFAWDVLSEMQEYPDSSLDRVESALRRSLPSIIARNRKDVLTVIPGILEGADVILSEENGGKNK